MCGRIRAFKNFFSIFRATMDYSPVKLALLWKKSLTAPIARKQFSVVFPGVLSPNKFCAAVLEPSIFFRHFPSYHGLYPSQTRPVVGKIPDRSDCPETILRDVSWCPEPK